MRKMRITALCLALLMVVLLFAGCGKKEPSDTDPSSSSSTSASVTEPGTSETNVDLNGFVFAFVNGRLGSLYFAEPANADQQAIMEVIHEIEDTYNCTITNNEIGDGNDVLRDALLTASFAGEKFGDAIFGNQAMYGPMILNNYALRLDTDEVRATAMDVLNPAQFNSHITNCIKIADKAYAYYICGEYIAQQLPMFLAFNKTMCTNIGYNEDDIYDSVRNGSWTWDVLIDISRAGRVLNTDTNEYDVYGISHVFHEVAMMSIANDLVIYKDGKYVNGTTTVPFISAWNLLATRVFGDPGITPAAGGNAARRQLFYDQKALFGTFSDLRTPYENSNFEYGIVPYPRGSYNTNYTCVSDYVNAFCIQALNKDWKDVCFLLGEMGNRLNDGDAAVDKLSGFVRDAKSLEMIKEYILPNLATSLYKYNDDARNTWNAMKNDMLSGNVSIKEAIESYKAELDSKLANAYKLINK